MNIKVKKLYIEHIAECLRSTCAELGIKEVPQGTILCLTSYHVLADREEIAGIPVRIVWGPTERSWFLVAPLGNNIFLKCFDETVEVLEPKFNEELAKL